MEELMKIVRLNTSNRDKYGSLPQISIVILKSINKIGIIRNIKYHFSLYILSNQQNLLA